MILSIHHHATTALNGSPFQKQGAVEVHLSMGDAYLGQVPQLSVAAMKLHGNSFFE